MFFFYLIHLFNSLQQQAYSLANIKSIPTSLEEKKSAQCFYIKIHLVKNIKL